MSPSRSAVICSRSICSVWKRTAGWTATETAARFGCSESHVSRVERGSSRPSRSLVQFYEDEFEGDGLLFSLFEVVIQSREDKRRRNRGPRGRQVRAIEGDSSVFVDDTVPHGTLVNPGQLFVKTWRIRNAGEVPWRCRMIERQGPLTGPGLITSLRRTEIPDAEPGETIEIEAPLRAPGYGCSTIAYFKMIDADGYLCFPDDYQLGLDVLVRVTHVTSMKTSIR
jgi:transcriptional regulator with XRE-family HTH domain